MKEKREFFFKVKIKDRDEKIKELSGKKVIEITWDENNIGENKKEGDLITFEKDGNSYKFVVKIRRIKKGWFKDSMNIYSLHPAPGEEFVIWCPSEEEKKWKKGVFEKKPDTEDTDWNVKSTQWRAKGFVVVGVILISGIIALVLWNRNKFRKSRT